MVGRERARKRERERRESVYVIVCERASEREKKCECKCVYVYVSEWVCKCVWLGEIKERECCFWTTGLEWLGHSSKHYSHVWFAHIEKQKRSLKRNTLSIRIIIEKCGKKRLWTNLYTMSGRRIRKREKMSWLPNKSSFVVQLNISLSFFDNLTILQTILNKWTHEVSHSRFFSWNTRNRNDGLPSAVFFSI